MYGSWLLHTLYVSAATARHFDGRIAKRQDGPVDPGIAGDCTYYQTAVSADYTCTYVEQEWGISHRDFVSWNPSVRDDCSGIKVGNSYCVEVNFGLPRTTSTVGTTSQTTTAATGASAPSPTQAGLIGACTAFYRAVAGDTCDRIASKYGIFSTADFLAWNPAVGADCSGLWASYYYCVGVPGTPTTKPTDTSASPTSKPAGPSPTQDGIVSTCVNYYKAVSGDTCAKIVDRYGTFTADEFYSWNPAVGTDCLGLWSGYNYCVGIAGTPTAKPATLSTTTTKPTPSGPSPAQPGITSTCTQYYKAVSGDTCAKIVDTYGTFTLDQFTSWNPAVSSDCSGLWVGYYYCIGVPGTPITKRPVPSPSQTGCTSAPKPTQPGAICACSRWHQVASGNTCDSIEKQYGISPADFNTWNPQVGGDCSTLWLGYYVCVGR